MNKRTSIRSQSFEGQPTSQPDPQIPIPVHLGCPVRQAALLATALLPALTCGAAPEATITIQADRPRHRISRLLTGACIEDVNHEIYGGLYSQMIFGESFEEPPAAAAPVKDFKSYGGSWRVHGDELEATGQPGDRLVSDTPPFVDGEIGVEVFVSDRSCRNAGLIVRVANPGFGNDAFNGYEIALNAGEQNVRLGRHRHNWTLLKDVPCEVPTGEWVTLMAKLTGRTIEVIVNGKTILRHEDRDAALLSGTVGLRQFQPEARYRNLWVKTGGETRKLAFAVTTDPPVQVSAMWQLVRRGSAAGECLIEKEQPFLGRQSQRVTFTGGQGEIGVANQGLNRRGMCFRAGMSYEGILWARSEKNLDVCVSLEDGASTPPLAQCRLPVEAGDWQKLTFTLTPEKETKSGRFTVSIRDPGSVVLGYAFLQPGDWGRFKGLPVRRDVAEGLIEQGITVLRYGGSMINAGEYRWKKMIGPRDRRPPYQGTWYPHSSNGWGIPDFMNFCEAAGFEYIPAFNMGETPQDMVDFIEYAKAPADTKWGRKRMMAGHKAPYRLKYIELGNEEHVNDDYFARFKSLAEAIWAADPDIILVVGDWWYNRVIENPYNFAGGAVSTLAAQKKILDLAKEHNREVWFDIHVETPEPPAPRGLAVQKSFIDQLTRLNSGAKFKVVIFEFNAGNHSQKRALSNAMAISLVESDGRIPVAASANCLQPDGQNDNGWDQGLLFLNPSQVWLQPPGYVTRMISQNYQPMAVPVEITGQSGSLYASAKRSEDGKVLVIQIVNYSMESCPVRLHVDGFKPANESAQVEELTAGPDDCNTATEPLKVRPRRSEWRHGWEDSETVYSAPAFSFSVIEFQ